MPGNYNSDNSHSNVQCKISGSVLDSITNKPIEFATVAVYKMKDTLLVGGAVTNDKGTFSVEPLMPGFYFIKVGYIGYINKKISAIKLTPDVPVITLPDVLLVSNGIELKNVTVTDNSDAFQNTIDKKIFNVDKNLTSQGGNALDVLNQIPSVSVDLDGNLSLRGSGNVTVLIDGKPSSLTGGGNNLLSQIPASTIESVELITNPSAKYDPDGTSGIINIVLKKNKKNGLNGSITVGTGSGNNTDASPAINTLNKLNSSANINYRNGKWNLFANYGFTDNNRWGFGNVNRHYFSPDSSFYFKQNSNSTNQNISHLLKGGVDFSLNDHNAFTLSSTFSPGTEGKTEYYTYKYFDSSMVLSSLSKRDAVGSSDNKNLDINFDYKHTFKKPKQEWTIDATRSVMNSPGTKTFNQYYYDNNLTLLTDTAIHQIQNSTSVFRTYIFQTDYTDPFKNGKFETGAKYSHRLIDNVIDSRSFNITENAYTADSNINNEFIFNEDVIAAYAVLTKTIGSFTYQAGLRAEQAYTAPQLVNTDSVYHSNFFSLFPSGAVMKSFDKNLSAKLSYSRRINRPMVMNLNPFPDYNDPTSVRVGNPYLKPEYVDAYEFSINKLANHYSFGTTLYYRQTNNAFLRYVTITDSGVAHVTFTNLNTNTSFGFEVNTKFDVTKNCNISANFNLFRNEVDANNIVEGLTNHNLSASGRFSSNLSLPKNFLFQINSNYRSPMVVAQGQMLASFNLDSGLKKDVMKKKGTLTFNVTDIFNTQQMGMNLNDTYFSVDFVRKKESRVATLSFTYRFGVQDKNQKQQDRNNQQQNYQNQDMGF